MNDLYELARSIDHTLLRAEATSEDIVTLCREARKWRFAAVCVNPVWVELAVAELEGSEVGVAAVCGFPLGASLTPVKVAEAARAVTSGAAEIDMVQQIGLAVEGRWDAVGEDVRAVAGAVHAGGAVLKVILECGLLSDDAKERSARVAVAAGADFVKTSTGFLAGGATIHDVALLRKVVGEAAGVKASGGIRSLGRARAMLAAGATRLGTSSGVRIMEEAHHGGAR